LLDAGQRVVGRQPQHADELPHAGARAVPSLQGPPQFGEGGW
jgi:hypothetical protein